MVTSLKPGEERRTHTADVQHTGGTWGKTSDDHGA
jgi:hypothetical protein